MNAQHAPMVIAAARVLNKRMAEHFGVDAEDRWKAYGDALIDEAQEMLDAAAAPDLLEAALEFKSLFDPAAYVEEDCSDAKYAAVARKFNAAIAKATGGAA